METDRIKELIESGTPICQLDKEGAKRLLKYQATNAFIKVGVHRSMTPDAFQQEVEFCAEMLYNDIVDDPRYKNIRDKEFPYLFSEGVKGRLGADKDIVLTYKSIIRWIEGYVTSQIRKDAVVMYMAEKEARTPKLAAHEITDEELKVKVLDAWTAYQQYRCSKRLNDLSDDSPRTVGEAIGMPIECLDYGRIRADYLVRIGYARPDEKLVDVFGRAYDNGGKFVKV